VRETLFLNDYVAFTFTIKQPSATT